MTRVVLLEDWLDHARHMACVQRLAARADLTILTDRARDADHLLERIAGAEIVITIRDRVMFSRDVLERARSLRLLSVCGPRLQPHIDLPAATRAGILVTCPAPAPGPAAPHHATAELTWALILGLAKSLEHHQTVMRAGGWQTRLSSDLAGRTLGVIGSTGKVGQVVTTIGRALGMRVLAWSPRLNAARASEQGVEAVALQDLLGQSDVVTLHANATADSTRMIGKAQLMLMKQGAILVNTARAALIDEQALREVLDAGRLAGVGLDVYWQEPLPADHWLRSHPRVLMQPHLGGFSHQGYEWIIEPGVEAALAWLDERPIHYANPQALQAGKDQG
jgi:phosphoglycerate dehydrogenase-like enzyme